MRAILLGMAVAVCAPGASAQDQRDLRQVQIQVWISEAGEQGLRDLGANLKYTRFIRGQEQDGNVQQIDSQVHANPNTQYGVTLPVQDQALFDPPMRPDMSPPLSDGLQTQEGVGMTFTLIAQNYGSIDGIFRAIETSSDLDLISKPELLVINNTPAEIHAGGEIPYQAISYNNNVPQLKVTWQPIGVSMKLTPSIRNDDLIELHIEQLEVSDIARIDSVRGIDLPVFSSRSQSGKVLVPNAQTLVIGGLSSRTVRRAERRVPVLGAIPIVGVPFRSRETEANTSQLVILVSPTVVDVRGDEGEVRNALEFWRREDWSRKEAIEEERDRLDRQL